MLATITQAPDVATVDLARPAVSLERASCLFGSFAALRDVSFALAEGSSAVLLGENGAGKSTLLKLVAGLNRPTYGTVKVLGERPTDCRGRIAYMSHATMLYDELTATENLRYFGELLDRKLGKDEVAGALLDVGLDPANPRRVGEYSQGMRQRASLARTLLGQPDLLLLDEPFSNLDAGSAHRMIERLQAYLALSGAAGAPRTLLLTTHQAELASPLARTTLTLSEGRLTSRVDAPMAAGVLPL